MPSGQLVKLIRDKKQHFQKMKQSSYSSLAVSLDKKSNFIFTDEELISRFQNGDERAYVELVNRYKDRLLNFVFQFLGDIEQAEDVVQDTMLRLYEKKHYCLK